jgi:predicted Zn-dependent protease
MTPPLKPTDTLMRLAQKLVTGKAGHSPTQKPGYLHHASGRWRSPEMHEKILAAYSEAHQLEPRNDFALFSRALEHMHVGHYELAERDLTSLAEAGSAYAIGTLPVNLYLHKGDRRTAQKHLDALNAKNTAKGLPRQTLADFEMWH